MSSMRLEAPLGRGGGCVDDGDWIEGEEEEAERGGRILTTRFRRSRQVPDSKIRQIQS